ncbi:hypothetical protein ACO0QE_003132 [Hanseniaspora vineae]
MSKQDGIVRRILNRIYKPSSTASQDALAFSKYNKWTREQLILRIQELEQENKNAKLQKSLTPTITRTASASHSTKSQKHNAKKPAKPFDYSKYNTRSIALKFAYLGWNYNGLAIQKTPTPLPTVEGVILETMLKCKLIPNMNTTEYDFSRCGRTDKGVSAMNQVISLKVRSNLTPEEQSDSANDSREIDYIRVLNNGLPPDIRIHAVMLRPPPGFDARFSCKYRHYKYIFKKTNGLDIEAMQRAAALYVGPDKDFRNFCKLDGSKQITNFKRHILSAKILTLNDAEQLYCFDLKGSAFLWHQVRNMMAILFLIGQGLEKPEIITDLMNVEKYPRKPIYDMANDIPLILYDCKFKQELDAENFDLDTENKEILRDEHYGEQRDVCGLEWISGSKFTLHGRTLNNVFATRLDYEIKNEVSKIFSHTSKDQSMVMAMSETNLTDKNKVCIDLGDGRYKNTGKYEPISKRPVQSLYEDINAKYKQKKAHKFKK